VAGGTHGILDFGPISRDSRTFYPFGMVFYEEVEDENLAVPTHRSRVGATISWWVVATMFASTLQAQARGEDDPVRRLPRLGNHRFVLSTTFPDPFIATYVRSMTGAGAVKGDIPVDTTGLGTATSRTGTSAFLVLGFEYQQALGNRFAIWGNVGSLPGPGGPAGSSCREASISEGP